MGSPLSPQPFRKLARTLKSMLRGLLNAIEQRVANAHLEGLNSKLQTVKRSACNAIYFHLCGLDLHPASLTRSKA